ncbi:MAG: hypothetical protein ACE5OY_06890 [Candidatus Bathyarchaeia archaeon]
MGLTWDEAVLHVLGSYYPHEVSLKTIYFEVDKYRKLAEKDFEVTKYDEPRYKRIVRATLNQLIKEDLVERIRRGVYILRE